MLALAGVIGGNFYMKQKKRAELIAGCVVPKENVVIDKKEYIEVISDAKIVTTNISQRNETGVDVFREVTSKDFAWCLDTTVTVEVKSKQKIQDYQLEHFKKNRTEYSG